MSLVLTKTGCQPVKNRDDCSTEFAVEKLDDRLVNHSETINRGSKLVVLHSAVQVSWNDALANRVGGRC